MRSHRCAADTGSRDGNEPRSIPFIVAKPAAGGKSDISQPIQIGRKKHVAHRLEQYISVNDGRLCGGPPNQYHRTSNQVATE